MNENEKNKRKEYYNNQTKLYDKKINKNKKNNRCKNKNINSEFNLEQKIINKNNIKININKLKNSKSPIINKIGNQNLNLIKDSIVKDNSTSYNKHNSKKKNNIIINYKKNLKNNNYTKHDDNNRIIVNQIIQNFKTQIKQNILSNEHLVKSERISPIKKEIISKNIKNSNNNISKEISKNKEKNSDKNKNNIKNNNKVSLISNNTKNDEEKKEQNKSNNKNNKINNNNNNKNNDELNFFEIEISNTKNNSSINNNSSSEKSISKDDDISKIEVESANHKICSIDSIESLKKYKKKLKEKEKDKEKEKEEETIINIDIPIEIKKKDPQYLNEYLEEILETLLTEENYFLKKKYINPHYLENVDSELTPEMRTVAVDWLALIHHKIFKFKENTFFLAIQIFDRYLSDIILSVEKTELLLLTSFTLASKHEEVEYVNMQETLQLAQNKFDKEQIIKMEYEILKQIKFEILAPTMCDFFKIFAFFINFNNDKLFQGLYILNIILVDFHMLEYPNCALALAVIKLINKKINVELFDLVNKIINNKKLECL